MAGSQRDGPVHHGIGPGNVGVDLDQVARVAPRRQQLPHPCTGARAPRSEAMAGATREMDSSTSTAG